MELSSYKPEKSITHKTWPWTSGPESPWSFNTVHAVVNQVYSNVPRCARHHQWYRVVPTTFSNASMQSSVVTSVVLCVVVDVVWSVLIEACCLVGGARWSLSLYSVPSLDKFTPLRLDTNLFKFLLKSKPDGCHFVDWELQEGVLGGWSWKLSSTAALSQEACGPLLS